MAAHGPEGWDPRLGVTLASLVYKHSLPEPHTVTLLCVGVPRD